MCASVYLHACMCSVYVQGPQNYKRASDTPTLESHAAVSHLVGAGAGTWPQEEQQTLLTTELPLQPHGSSCDANMKEQYWLLPVGILNPYGTLYPEWILWMFFVSTYTIYLENTGLLNYTDILNYIMLKNILYH